MTATIGHRPVQHGRTWQCGFCCTGQHELCTRGAQGRDGRILRCSCHQCKTKAPICLNCKREVPLTDWWTCLDVDGCLAYTDAKAAANPLRALLAKVRTEGLNARQKALALRIAAQVAAVGDVPSPPRNGGGAKASDCQCGCGGQTKGGKFLPGHDMRLKGVLRRAAASGDQAARDELIERGWATVK